MDFLKLFLFFWIMSIVGWIMEVLVCSIEARKFINRGFLIGPYCPIYGFGGVILLMLYPLRDNMFLVFILSIILCSILEYLTSYIMECIFKVRWWDYSNEPFNINGRICLRNALAFGVLGTVLVCFLIPFIYNFLNSLSNNLVITIFVITLIITLTDLILSLNIMQNIKGSIEKMNKDKTVLRDATDDIKAVIKNVLSKKTYFYRRFIKSYDKFEYYRNGFVHKIKNRRKTISFEIFCASGLLVGIIAGIITHHMFYSIFLSLCIAIILNLLYDKIMGGNSDNK